MDESLDWNHVQTFLAVAEEGSFSQAGRRLGLSQPSVGRQVAALEQALDVALFERQPRGMSLTTHGVELVDHARKMGAAAGDLLLAASGRSTALEGLVRLSASASVAAFSLPAVVEKIRSDYPGIILELIATSDLSNLRTREADIAVRHVRPSDPALLAKRVADQRTRLYATPECLARHKGNLDYIGFGSDERLVRDLNTLGLSLTLADFPLVAPDHLVQWELVKQGLGVGLMLEAVGDGEPSVVRVQGDDAVLESPTYLVCHRELKTTRRLRVVFDLLAEALSTPCP